VLDCCTLFLRIRSVGVVAVGELIFILLSDPEGLPKYISIGWSEDPKTLSIPAPKFINTASYGLLLFDYVCTLDREVRHFSAFLTYYSNGRSLGVVGMAMSHLHWYSKEGVTSFAEDDRLHSASRYTVIPSPFSGAPSEANLGCSIGC
jgi:hypothetical protein